MSAPAFTTRFAVPVRGTEVRIAANLGPAYMLSIAIAALMTFASAYALLEWPRVYAGSEPDLVPLLVGQDALNLVVGLPLLVGAMALARRGSLAGLVLWPGALFYVAYDYGYYVLGVPYGWFFIPYIVLVSASLFTAVFVIAGIDGHAVRARMRRGVPARVAGAFLMGLAVLFTALWSALNMAALMSATEVDPILRVVTIMDLGLQLPALFVGGLLLWRGAALGYVVSAGLLVQAAAYLAGLSAITMLQESLSSAPFDPVAVLPGFIVGAIGLGILARFIRATRQPASA